MEELRRRNGSLPGERRGQRHPGQSRIWPSSRWPIYHPNDDQDGPDQTHAGWRLRNDDAPRSQRHVSHFNVRSRCSLGNGLRINSGSNLSQQLDPRAVASSTGEVPGPHLAWDFSVWLRCLRHLCAMGDSRSSSSVSFPADTSLQSVTMKPRTQQRSARQRFMSSKANPTIGQQTAAHALEQTNSQRADCLLCRVLWPNIVPHRHLEHNYSSEATTLFLTNARPPHHHRLRY